MSGTVAHYELDRQREANMNPHGHGQERKCQWCGQTFYSYVSGGEANQPNTCSPECWQSNSRYRAFLTSIRNKYGLTAESYAAAWNSQHGKCGICYRALRLPGGLLGLGRNTSRSTAVIDHDHVTGAVRGLLCNGCNTKLCGFDEPDYRDAALKYFDAPPSWATCALPVDSPA